MKDKNGNLIMHSSTALMATVFTLLGMAILGFTMDWPWWALFIFSQLHWWFAAATMEGGPDGIP